MNIAFIPVRGGSKSIPLKNIKILNGKPLVYWTAKAANDACCIDEVVIATDSDDIKRVVKSFNLPKITIYDRETQNAADTSSTESVMLEYLYKTNLQESDLFFLIQATSPMLKASDIDGMYDDFNKSGVDSMFTGVIEKQFHWRFADDNTLAPVNYDYNHRPRRQDFEGLVAENGACYINSVKNILKNKCRLSGKIGFYELPSYTAYEIDEETDWIIAEELMKRYGFS